MCRKRFRSISAGVYLLFLAIADNSFLFFNSMTTNFTRLTFDWDFRVVSVAACKVYIFLLLSSKCVSAWIIVAMTVERLIVAVTFPSYAATRFRAWIVSITTILVVGGIFMFTLFVYTHEQRDDGSQWWIGCHMAEQYRNLGLALVKNLIDLVFFCILPSIILFVCNAALTCVIVGSRRLRRRSSATAENLTRSYKLTLMLMLVSCTFLILNLPMSLFLLANSVVSNMESTFPHWALTYRILYTLQIMNSAINFPLYCLSGPMFRREVAALCCCKPCCSKPKRKFRYELVYRQPRTASYHLSDTTKDCGN